MRFVTQWTPEMDAIIKERYRSAGTLAIAKLLGVSKNAVVGRANRLGLQDAARSPIKHGGGGLNKGKTGKRQRVDAQPLGNVGPSPRACRFIESDERPYPDDPFCGAAVKPGSSWCPEHHERVFTRKPVALDPPAVNDRTGRVYR